MDAKVRLGPVALALAVLAAPAAGQLRVTGSTSLGGTWIMAELPSRFAIRSAASTGDVVVTDAELASRSVSLGATVGLRFGGGYGVEGLLQWVPTKLEAARGLEGEAGGVEGDMLMYSVTGLYHFAESGPFKPFFGVGIGAQTTRFDRAGWRGETEPMANLLAGGEVDLGRGVALRFDARNCISVWRSRVDGVDDSVSTEAVFSLGLAFGAPIGE